jgi:hypothetical protein
MGKAGPWTLDVVRVGSGSEGARVVLVSPEKIVESTGVGWAADLVVFVGELAARIRMTFSLQV